MDRTGMDAEIGLEHEQFARDDRFRNEFIRACRLASSGEEIGAVHVYAGRRPTYGEIVQFRAVASQYGLNVTIHGDGRVTFRRNAFSADVQMNGRETHWFRPVVAIERRAELSLGWVKAHLTGWDAGFQGVREGVR